MRTTGNTILVSGGTSGIGRALAERWHADGNTVVVAGRRKDLLDEVAAEHPGIGTLELDVTDPDSVLAAAEVAAERFPALDVLVTMAGIMRTEDLRDPAHLADAEATVTTNLLGTIRTVAAFLPQLLARPQATVMTVSSGLAFVPLPVTPTYNATKAGVHAYTESLRVQLAGTAVQVVELVPPAVQTGLLGTPDPSWMPLGEFVDEVAGILAREPGVREVLVDRVRPLRFAEVDGTYDQVLAAMAG
ncbi:SDR family NAD(P)-dependent oxidoreductase [Modestobacter sp. NPDC049651]|uniref:SDR family oxidoreductase n=1 Tax=unclassified Modestobacter TaxID=2643866 RepID=UPI0033C8FDA5